MAALPLLCEVTNVDTLELVLRLSNGAIRIPLKKSAYILGLEPQTIRNRMHEGKWPVQPIREGRNVYFHATDVAQLIDDGKYPSVEPGVPPVGGERKARRGTSTARERQAAQACGLSVKEWRTRALEVATV